MRRFSLVMLGLLVHLFRCRRPLDGNPERLTDSPPGSMHYHPSPFPDCTGLLYGSKRDGVRQLYVMCHSDRKEWRITDLKTPPLWSHWQPAAKTP